MSSLHRIIALIIKEFTMVLKDPKSRFVVIGPPLIQFFIFGYAATFDLKDVRYAVLDQCRTTESRQLLARFEGSPHFQLTQTLSSTGQIAPTIDNEKARLVLHIGPQFSRNLNQGSQAELQVIIDGRNSNVALIALGYIGIIIEQYAQEVIQAAGASREGAVIKMVERAWYNDNLQSRWFIVSALGGVISMVVVMILTSLSVAREREFGTFDQLLVAPFKPGEILVGKSIPGIVFGLMDALIFSAGAVFWFGVPFRGTILALVLALLCFIIAMVGVGLLVSSLSMTMQQALLGSFIFMMPSVILSGFATPVANMPQWLQIGTLANPVRYIIYALRTIFLEGADVAMVWPHIWPLMLIAAVTLPMASWLFRHRAK